MYVFNKFEIDESKLIIDKDLYCPTDIEDIYGYNQKAKKVLGWNYNMSFFDVLDILCNTKKKALYENSNCS